MKLILVLFIISLGSCSHKINKREQLKNEYEIVQLALNHFKRDEIRLLEIPYNSNIEGLMRGFSVDSLNLESYTFTFANNKTDKWSIKNNVFSNTLKNKITIIENPDRIEEVSFYTPEKAKEFTRLSNVAFSINNEYALLYIGHFSNMYMGPSEGYIMIFKFENNKWNYIMKFLVAVS